MSHLFIIFGTIILTMARTKAFNEQEVLKKAMELFWEKGFHATSMQDLVDHLGINRASMYDTFGGKDQLFLKSLRLYLQKSRANIQELREILKGKSTKAFLSEYLHKVLEKKETINQKGCFAANTTSTLSKGDKKISALLTDNMEENVKFFEVIIRIGQEREEIDPQKSAHDLARHLFVFLNGLNIVSKLKPKEPLCSLVNAQIDLLFQK